MGRDREEVKWKRPPADDPMRDRYQTSADGKWMVNKAFVRGEPVYMLVRLGKERRTARGEVLWEGSEIVCTGTLAECYGRVGSELLQRD